MYTASSCPLNPARVASHSQGLVDEGGLPLVTRLTIRTTSWFRHPAPHAAQSAQSNSACITTVFAASSCKSGEPKATLLTSLRTLPFGSPNTRNQKRRFLLALFNPVRIASRSEGSADAGGLPLVIPSHQVNHKYLFSAKQKTDKEVPEPRSGSPMNSPG
jgi:hypothetical protein